MLAAATIVTVYASPLIPVVIELAVAWAALAIALVAEVRTGRGSPVGPRTNVLVALASVLSFVSAALAYGMFLIFHA